MKCPHPRCTGVHDNNRYHELCPRSLDLKAQKEQRYEATAKAYMRRIRYHQSNAQEQLAITKAFLKSVLKGLAA